MISILSLIYSLFFPFAPQIGPGLMGPGPGVKEYGGGINGFTHSRSLTIDGTKVPNTDQANFPVLVSTTIANWKTTGNGGSVTSASGYDIVFTSDSGCTTLLSWEQETWSASSGSGTFWVLLPNVSHTSDTVFYTCYGKSSITTFQGGSTGLAWNSAFKGVWHLPNGTTLTASDSTAGGYNGTLNNSPTAVAGQIDGAGSFAQASSQTVSGSFTNVGLPVTISAWINISTINRQQGIFGTDSGSNNGYRMSVDQTSNKLQFVLGGVAAYTFSGLTAFSASTWYYVAVTVSGASGTANAYRCSAGTMTSSSASVGTPSGTPNAFRIANGNTATPEYFDGIIDEVRISNVARSADWLTTECNNQYSPSTFITVGPEV